MNEAQPQGNELPGSAEASQSMAASPNRRAWARFRANALAWWSTWAFTLVLAIVLLWPLVLRVAEASGKNGASFAMQHNPNQLSDDQFQPPNREHWFGTDVHGRDVFSRVLYGARISLLVGAVGAVVSLVIGVLWGAVAGYAGGRIDAALMRAVDVLYSMPSIIFVVVVVTTLEETARTWLTGIGSDGLAKSVRILFLFVGLGAVSWLNMARIVRGQVLTLRQSGFVEASRALGAGPWQILRRHIIPNTLGVVISYVTLAVPAIVLYESFLSYLGLGIQPPMASWGLLISEGAAQLNPIRIYWWLLVFPGGFLVGTLLTLSFIADGLRDAWDIRAAE